MMGSVFSKTLYEKRGFIFGWFIGFLALAALMTSFYPAMSQSGDSFDQLITQMPAAFKGLVGDLASLSSFDTYIASQLYDIRVPLIAGIMAIILGLGLSVKDEESGELRTLLAMPISRARLFFEQWLALVAVVVLSSLGLLAGMYIIMPFIEDASIDIQGVAQLIFLTQLVMITYGTITFAVGKATGNRGIASFVSIFVIIGSFLLSTFAAAVDWLKDYENFSLLHYFPAVEVVKEGLNLKDAAVFMVVSVACLLIAWAMFRQRDIA